MRFFNRLRDFFFPPRTGLIPSNEHAYKLILSRLNDYERTHSLHVSAEMLTYMYSHPHQYLAAQAKKYLDACHDPSLSLDAELILDYKSKAKALFALAEAYREGKEKRPVSDPAILELLARPVQKAPTESPKPIEPSQPAKDPSDPSHPRLLRPYKLPSDGQDPSHLRNSLKEFLSPSSPALPADPKKVMEIPISPELPPDPAPAGTLLQLIADFIPVFQTDLMNAPSTPARDRILNLLPSLAEAVAHQIDHSESDSWPILKETGLIFTYAAECYRSDIRNYHGYPSAIPTLKTRRYQVCKYIVHRWPDRLLYPDISQADYEAFLSHLSPP